MHVCNAMDCMTPGYKVGDDAFAGCSSLIAVSVSDTLSTLGGGTFQGCTSLKAITLPGTCCCTSAGPFSSKGTFHGCTALELVVLPLAAGTAIHASTFDGCVQIRYIYAADSVVAAIGRMKPKPTPAVTWDAGRASTANTSGASVAVGAGGTFGAGVGAGADDGVGGIGMFRGLCTLSAVPPAARLRMIELHCWSPRIHKCCSPRAARCIMAALLVGAASERPSSDSSSTVYDSSCMAATANTKEDVVLQVLPCLPPEIWVYLLTFVRRKDLGVYT